MNLGQWPEFISCLHKGTREFSGGTDRQAILFGVCPLPSILVASSLMEDQTKDTFTKRVLIGADHRIRIDLDIPADFPEGEAEATVKIKLLASEKNKKNRLRAIRGKGEGRFWMSDDFDEPLEDFAEYM